MRDSFIFYRSFYEAIRELPRDVQGEIYTAIMEYGLYGKETEQLKPMARSIFILIKPILSANAARQENASKGGAPKGLCNNPNGRRGNKPIINQEQTENKPRTNQELTETNQEQTENKPNKERDKDKDIDIDTEGDSKGEDKPPMRPSVKKFIPPTIEQVQTYCSTRGNNVNPEQFVSYYTANGWKVGKNPMKDWKAAVRTWENNGYSNNGKNNGGNKDNPLANQQWRDSSRTQEWNFTDSSDFE